MNGQQEKEEKLRKFSQRLTTRAARLGIQQNEIAHAVGVEPSAVSAWMRGANFAKGKNLRLLSEKLQCTAEWLIGDTDQQLPFQQHVLKDEDMRRTALSPAQLRLDELAALARWLTAAKSDEELNGMISRAASEGRSDVARALLDIKDTRRATASATSSGREKSKPVEEASRQVAGALVEGLKKQNV